MADLQVDFGNVLSSAAAAAIFSVGGAWGTMRVLQNEMNARLKKLEKWQETADENLETAKHSRNITRACMSMLIETVQDPARKRLLEIMWAEANSPVKIKYPPLRDLVAARGRPPAYVLDGIRKIAAMNPADDVEVLAYIGLTFTPEQIDRAANAHATVPGSPSGRADFNELARLFFADVRDRGGDVDGCLRDAGLID